MKTIIVMHPHLAIAAATIPLIVALVLVWRGRPAIRMAAAALGLSWAIAATAYLTTIVAEAGFFLDRKNFILLPVDAILHDISSTAQRGDLESTRLKVSEFQRNWNTICMTTNDPWVIQVRIESIGTKEEANKTGGR